jgi:glycerol kinase
MGGEFLLSLDLGTSGVRALVVGLDGGVRASAWRRLATRFPAPGRVEQDPEEFVAASTEVLRAALDTSGLSARDVAALGIATQRATALAWEARSARPLAPALGWQDQRGREIADQLRERGLPSGAQPAAAKFAWWLERDAGVRAAARRGTLRLGTPDAWLTRHLAGDGQSVTDPGQASCTALYDFGRGDWSPVLLERLGLAPETLPSVSATSGVVAETPASLLGAPVPLAARAGDQQAAAFAQGVHAPGEAKLTLGTAAMLDVHTGDAPSPPVSGSVPLALWRLADGEQAFCLEGSVTTAGAAVEWLVALGVLGDASELDHVAGSVAGPEGVVCVPALQGLGTPFNDEGARGFVGGLTRGSGRGHLARAVLEGIAQRCTDLCEALLSDRLPLRVDGGLARSDRLLQALADLSGRELERAAQAETTALGAALLAGLATGHLAGAAACRELRGPPQRFAPGTDAARARDARARWRRILTRRVLA